MNEMTDSIDNVAEAIFREAIARIDRVAVNEGDQQQLARFLILQDLWRQLTRALGQSPEDLQDMLDGAIAEMEGEEEEEFEDEGAE